MAKKSSRPTKILARVSPISIHRLVFQLGEIAALPLSTGTANATKKANDDLAGHFEFCLHTLHGDADRRMPISNVTNDARRKVGPKTSAGRAEHNQKLRMTALVFLLRGKQIVERLPCRQ